MAETVGRVDFIAGLDGTVAVNESRRVGDQIGREGEKAGAGFGDNFDRELTPRMRLAGDRAAKAITAGLGKIDTAGFSKAIGRLESSMGDSMSRMSDDTERFRLIFDDLSTDVVRRSTDIARVSKEIDFGRWSEDAGTFRQVFHELEGDVDRLSNSAGQNTLVWHENQRAIEAMTDSLGGAGRGGDGVADSFRNVGDEGGDGFRRAAAGLRNLWNSIDAGEPGIRRLNVSWSDLSHNTKQWTLIIGAVMAGMQDLAVLSSAAGAGVFALGGALSAAVFGGGAAVAVFSVLAKDISDLPPELQRTAVQFKALGTELRGTRDIIASSAIQRMPNTFAKLRGTVQGLNPAFAALGTSVGTVFDDMADGLRQGTPGFRELNGLVLNASQDFPALAAATGTWATALMRGLNNANPMVDQLIGYVQELGDRFDAFTQSDSFDQWIANSMATFTDFGELLDATGRALNDLVTPGAIARTQEFLDNLTAFMPNLSLLLDVLGRLDVFGLAAQALSEFGTALEPLSAPAQDLADALNDVSSILISELATALGIVATLVSPVVQGFADFVDAIPPGVLAGIATGVIGVATAFQMLRGVQGIAGAANAAVIAAGNFGTLASATGRAEGVAGKLATGLGKFAGAAGIFGIAASGAFILVDALGQAAHEMANLDDIAARSLESNKSLTATVSEMSSSWSLLGGEMTNTWDDVLNNLDGFDAFWSGFVPNFGGGLEDIFTDVSELNRTLTELDAPLAALAQVSLPDAAAKFSAWMTEIGATDAQIATVISRMPEFESQIRRSIEASGGFATETNILTTALTGSTTAMDGNTAQQARMVGQGTVLMDTTDQMSQTIRQYTDANLAARDASRGFEQATDDLSASIETNGNTLDRTTEQGRNNERAVDDLAAATLRYSDETLKNTGNQEKANAVIADGRQRLIEQLDAFGITGAEAEAYADSLGLIVPTVDTQVNTPGLSSAWDNARAYENQIRDIPTSWSTTVTTYYRQVGETLPKTATGGTFYGAQARIIGEAGPEAVVPLNRPLDQVDPSVRELSAIAQGLALPPMAAGGVVGGGTSRTVIFEAGAIVVEAADDPRQTAYDVLDVVAEKISS